MTSRARRPSVSRRVMRGFHPDTFRELRECAGFTRGDLARLADLSTAAVGAWESGRRRPQVDTLARAMKVLGRTMADVVVIPPDGRYLGDLRVLSGKTQPQLAAAAGISTAQLGALERGEVALTEPAAEKIAAALDITPRDVRTAWRRARNRPAGEPA